MVAVIPGLSVPPAFARLLMEGFLQHLCHAISYPAGLLPRVNVVV